jgi:hypothetical protein
MEIQIRVAEAINFYNRNKKPKTPKMTYPILGSHVFKGEDLKEETMKNYLSQWNEGERTERLRVWHICAISQTTGFPINELITFKK